jgi:flavin-dependent dehydrogenase
VDTEIVPGDRPRSLLHFDATDRRVHGYAWDFPTVVGGEELVCRGIYHLKTGRDEDPDIAVLLAARLQAQGVDPSRCRNRRYAERGFEPATRLARGPRMLVGEAAGIDPVTGEGIAQAIEYGMLAGGFLARALREQRDGVVALDAWERQMAASRLGRDLRIRTRLMGLYYGPMRAHVESFLAESPDALFVGGQHFAAHPYDWAKLTGVLGRGAALVVAGRIADVLRR